MAKLKIRQFEQWFQVVSAEGYTVAQFLRREDAEHFRKYAGMTPLIDAGIEYKYVPLLGQTIKHINLYP